MKNILKITFVTAMLALFTGCETTELDLLDNPNAIGAEVASPNFVLNQIQLSFNGIVSGFRGSSTNITRMTAQFGQYNGSVTVNSLNGTWSSAYNMFANVDLIEEISAGSEVAIPYHVALAQIMEAYTYISLVDYVGDVPYSKQISLVISQHLH